MTAYAGYDIYRNREAIMNGDVRQGLNAAVTLAGLVSTWGFKWCFVADTPVVRGYESQDVVLATLAPVSEEQERAPIWLAGGFVALGAACVIQHRRRRKTNPRHQAADEWVAKNAGPDVPPRDEEADEPLFGLAPTDLHAIARRWPSDDAWSSDNLAANDLPSLPKTWPHKREAAEPVMRERDARNAATKLSREGLYGLGARRFAAPQRAPSNNPRRERPAMNALFKKLMLLGCLLAAGVCFFKSLPGLLSDRGPAAAPAAQASFNASPAKRQLLTTPIVDIQPGMRVLANNPLDEDLQDGFETVDQKTWKQLRLRMTKEDRSLLHITLLRPDEWITAYEAAEGRSVFLDMEEMGAYGAAEVLSISACPQIEEGAGQVVTGKFEHDAADVIDLVIEGESQPIGTTAAHPFWSEDRQDFIPASELRLGETLLALDGSTGRLTSITPRDGPHRVYNLEVNVEHVYHVGESGLLVHNAYGGGGHQQELFLSIALHSSR